MTGTVEREKKRLKGFFSKKKIDSHIFSLG